MTHRLTIIVASGEKTCASEPGKFCQFLGSRRFGSEPVCTLFPSGEDSYTRLYENELLGWVMRCPACMEAEK